MRTQDLSLVAIVLALQSVHPEFESSQRLYMEKEPSSQPPDKKKKPVVFGGFDRPTHRVKPVLPSLKKKEKSEKDVNKNSPLM